MTQCNATKIGVKRAEGLTKKFRPILDFFLVAPKNVAWKHVFALNCAIERARDKSWTLNERVNRVYHFGGLGMEIWRKTELFMSMSTVFAISGLPYVENLALLEILNRWLNNPNSDSAAQNFYKNEFR